ncbi:MAG: accessory gene regulator B family protein [Eubacteriales bacterium]
MYLLERASKKLADKVSAELDYDQDRKEVVAYGAYAIMQLAFSILMIVVFGIIFDVLVEALVITASGAILRRYTGGAHASSPNICVVVGTVVCIGFALLSTLTIFVDFWLIVALVLSVYLISFWLINRFAPVDSENKPISEKRKPAMKRGGMILNGIYLLLNTGIIMGAAVSGNQKWLVFSVCIALGVLWQVFSITPVGGVWLGKLDRLLSFKRTVKTNG